MGYKLLKDVPFEEWYVDMPVEVHIEYSMNQKSRVLRASISNSPTPHYYENDRTIKVEWLKGNITHISNRKYCFDDCFMVLIEVGHPAWNHERAFKVELHSKFSDDFIRVDETVI